MITCSIILNHTLASGINMLLCGNGKCQKRVYMNFYDIYIGRVHGIATIDISELYTFSRG